MYSVRCGVQSTGGAGSVFCEVRRSIDRGRRQYIQSHATEKLRTNLLCHDFPAEMM